MLCALTQRLHRTVMTHDTILAGNPSIPHFGPGPVGGSTRALVIVFFSGQRTETVDSCKTTTGPDPYNVNGQYQLHNNLCGRYGSHSEEVSRNIAMHAFREGLHLYMQLPVRYLYEDPGAYKQSMQDVYTQLQIRDPSVRTPLHPNMFTPPKPWNTVLPNRETHLQDQQHTVTAGASTTSRTQRHGQREQRGGCEQEVDCVTKMPGDAVLTSTPPQLLIPEPMGDREGFIAKITEIEKKMLLSFNMCADAAWFHSVVLGTLHHFLQQDGFFLRPNSIRSDGPWYGNTWIDTKGTQPASVENIRACHNILWQTVHAFTKPEKSEDKGEALKRWQGEGHSGRKPVTPEMAAAILNALEEAGIKAEERVSGTQKEGGGKKDQKESAGKKDQWSRQRLNSKSVETKVSNIVYCAVAAQVFDAACDVRNGIMDWYIVRQILADCTTGSMNKVRTDVVMSYFEKRLQRRADERAWRKRWWVSKDGVAWLPPVPVMSALMGAQNFTDKAENNDILEWEHLDTKTESRDATTKRWLSEIAEHKTAAVQEAQAGEGTVHSRAEG